MGGRGQNYDIARDVIDTYGIDRATDSKNKIVNLFRRLDRSGGVRVSMEGNSAQVRISRDASAEVRSIAQELSDRLVVRDEGALEDYNDIRRQVSRSAFYMSARDRADIPDFSSYARSSSNFVRISGKGTTSVDQLYESLSEQYPQYFDRSSAYTPSDRLTSINETLSALKESSRIPLSRSDKSAATSEIARDLIQWQARRQLSRKRKSA